MNRWLLVVVLASLGGCFRLSDPIYAMKPLRATEPPGDEYSLVFLSIQRDGGLFASDIDTVYFRRVDPSARGYLAWTTSEFLFRVFDTRLAKNGHFLIQLSPGVYELDSLVSGRTHWLLGDEARVASRIYITRPGVFDLGTLRLDKPSFFGKYNLEAQGDAGSAERSRQLWDAVKGTSWERLVAAPPGDAR